MQAAAPVAVSGSVGELDIYVAADGSIIPVDASLLLPAGKGGHGAPTALVDLALGLLAEGVETVDFVWTGDETAPYWIVRLEKTELGRRTVARLRATRAAELEYPLTKRELDVLTLMVAGLSNAAIADALTVSPRTVTTHVDHIMRKIGVPSRSAAATLALDAGIVAVPLPVDASEFQTLRVGRIVRAAGTRVRRPVPHVRAAERNSPILIGSLIPLEGRARQDGVEMVRGAALAIDEVNARGGIHGHPLQLVVQNIDVDLTGLGNVTQAVHNLLGSGVHAITSGYLLHQRRAVELAAAEGVPFLHASAASCIDDLVSSDPDRFRGTFQVCPNDRNYAPNFVDFMTRLRDSGQWAPPGRELVVAQQNMWEIVDFGLARAFQMAADNGWVLVPVDVSDREGAEAAWSTLPGRIGTPAAVMLGSFFGNDHLRFIDSFVAQRSLPSRTLLYSIYAPSVPAFRRRLPPQADGLLWASTTGTYSDDIAREFAEKYKAKFMTVPGRSMAGISYDRAQLLTQAWSQVDDLRDYDDVSATLLRMHFRGVNGSYRFAGEGHGTLPLGTMTKDPSIAQAHTIFQIQQGRNVLLDPLIYAAGSFAPPAWFPQ
jgi:branched-chain amino acid transport system substrate-binding protein